ncbi:MAG: hypothetical protein JXR83_12385 [Deltaproteobacteria bacterium]|nr:hypothetical protein [Deltaproteobacteria bacterium]
MSAVAALALVLVAAPPSEAASAPALQPAPVPSRARPIGPAGVPLDVLPIAPLGGSLGYLVEAGAAAGVARLLGNACLLPVVGPVLYFVLAPGSIADAIEFVATRYTTTGLRDRRSALLAAYVVEGVAALFMLAGQALVISEIAALALLATGGGRGDVGLQQLGTAIAVGGGLGALVLLAASPLAIAAGIGGPHLEAMAYRTFDFSDLTTDLGLNEPGRRAPEGEP